MFALDLLKEWISSLADSFYIFVLPISYKPSTFDWLPFFSTLVGGFVTLVSAVATLWISNHLERKRVSEDERKLEASCAISGLLKLKHYANLIANIHHHINKSFKHNGRDGDFLAEPFQVLAPTSGKFFLPQVLTAEEYRFLISMKNSELLERVLLVEQRAINYLHLIEEYSKYRIEFEFWIETLPGFEREMLGESIRDLIPIKYKGLFEARAGKLNYLIGGIVEKIDEDEAEFTQVAQEFSSAAFEFFSPLVPKMTIIDRSNSLEGI